MDYRHYLAIALLLFIVCVTLFAVNPWPEPPLAYIPSVFGLAAALIVLLVMLGRLQ